MNETTPTPPEHLDATARDKWLEILPQLADQTPGTLDALTAYAVAWARMLDAEKQVTALGAVVKSPQGFPVPNPFLKIAQQERRAVRALANELHLLPIGRKVIRRPATETKGKR